MNDNGVFRRKNGFTIAGNTLTRDIKLSLKAKGLYLLIMSYITFENFTLTRSFIYSKCSEGEKAFSTAWDELKERGYLKVYLRPTSNGWKAEYELLDEPREGAHTFYLSSTGEVSSTNINRQRATHVNSKQHTPQKGSNAKGNNVKRRYAYGGNKIKTIYETNNNISNNNQSFIQGMEEMTDSELLSIVQEEIEKEGGIPYSYGLDKRRMELVIHYLTEWDINRRNGYANKIEQKLYNLAVDSLIEMACEIDVKIYNGKKVSYEYVIEKINENLSNEDHMNIKHIIEQAIQDFIKANAKDEIKHPKNYIKSCILNSFDTYEIKFESFFNKTYYSQ